MNTVKIQDYNDGAIYRTGVHSYEVRTSQGIGKGATVAEALKDLAKQVKPKKRKKADKPSEAEKNQAES